MLNSFHEGVTDSIYAVTTSPTLKAISGVVLNGETYVCSTK